MLIVSPATAAAPASRPSAARSDRSGFPTPSRPWSRIVALIFGSWLTSSITDSSSSSPVIVSRLPRGLALGRVWASRARPPRAERRGRSPRSVCWRGWCTTGHVAPSSGVVVSGDTVAPSASRLGGGEVAVDLVTSSLCSGYSQWRDLFRTVSSSAWWCSQLAAYTCTSAGGLPLQASLVLDVKHPPEPRIRPKTWSLLGPSLEIGPKGPNLVSEGWARVGPPLSPKGFWDVGPVVGSRGTCVPRLGRVLGCPDPASSSPSGCVRSPIRVGLRLGPPATLGPCCP